MKLFVVSIFQDCSRAGSDLSSLDERGRTRMATATATASLLLLLLLLLSVHSTIGGQAGPYSFERKVNYVSQRSHSRRLALVGTAECRGTKGKTATVKALVRIFHGVLTFFPWFCRSQNTSHESRVTTSRFTADCSSVSSSPLGLGMLSRERENKQDGR